MSFIVNVFLLLDKSLQNLKTPLSKITKRFRNFGKRATRDGGPIEIWLNYWLTTLIFEAG